MGRKVYGMHGRDHALGGADPIPGLGANLPWAYLSADGTQEITNEFLTDPNYTTGTMAGAGVPIQLALVENSSGFAVSVDGDYAVNIPGPGTFYVCAQARFDVQGYPYGYPHSSTAIAPPGGCIRVELAGSPDAASVHGFADAPVAPLQVSGDYYWNADSDSPCITANVECFAATDGATALVELYLRQHLLDNASVDTGTVPGDYPGSITYADPVLIVNTYTYLYVVKLADTGA